MKVLLLSDIPPSRLLTAGLVLEQLCQFLPPEQVACFVVTGSQETEVDSDIPAHQYRRMRGPNQFAPKLPDRWFTRPFNTLSSMYTELLATSFGVSRCIREAVNFGKEVGATMVWATLEGQTLIRMALPVAQQLGVPLFSQVYDPPEWWLRSNRVDGYFSRRVLGQYAATLRASRACAAASWAMAEEYESQYGVRSVPVIPSLPAAWAYPPAQGLAKEGQLTIALAGQLYASAEWQSLLETLNKVEWTIDQRRVVVRILGRKGQFTATSAQSIEFLGWRTQQETLQVLADSDILYCPYWFDPAFEKEARLSFPSKLTSYLAAGRPVLFHGPEYSSPARFLLKHEAGICCHSLQPAEILAALERLVRDAELYRRIAARGHETFLQQLTHESYQRAFFRFLQLDNRRLDNPDVVKR